MSHASSRCQAGCRPKESHEAGLDAAREQLGHSDPSVTYQRYVAARRVAPDLRPLLNRFFAPDVPAAEQGEARS